MDAHPNIVESGRFTEGDTNMMYETAAQTPTGRKLDEQ
jgi:hypothetical protein